MATHTITLDEVTEAGLQRLSAKEGRQASEYAARLLARAVRPRPVYGVDALKAAYAEFAEEDVAWSEATVAEHAARPRPLFDSAMLRAYAAENHTEELALADSDLEHRAQLLTDEDAA